LKEADVDVPSADPDDNEPASTDTAPDDTSMTRTRLLSVSATYANKPSALSVTLSAWLNKAIVPSPFANPLVVVPLPPASVVTVPIDH